MELAIEAVVLCALFTLGVVGKVRDPLGALYDYPPQIQERVRSLEQYRGKVPTQRDRLSGKLLAAPACWRRSP